MSVDRHHLLELFEGIHERYDLKEQDYKQFVEALGGKKAPIDIKNAKFVRITYDEITPHLCYDGDDDDTYDPYASVSVGSSNQTIREVIDTPSDATDYTYLREVGRRAPVSFTTCSDCTIINTAELEEFAKILSTTRPYWNGRASIVLRVVDIEVLQRN